MTVPATPIKPRGAPAPAALRYAAGAAAIPAALVLVQQLAHGGAAALRLKAPDWVLFAAQSPVVQAHVLAAVAALALGLVLFRARKGRRFHRVAGWGWVLLMAVVAGSSLFIRNINPGGFSWIHGLSGFSLLALPLAVTAARRHDVRRHRRTMAGLMLGGLVTAGAFSFLPGRLMWSIFFG